MRFSDTEVASSVFEAGLRLDFSIHGFDLTERAIARNEDILSSRLPDHIFELHDSL